MNYREKINAARERVSDLKAELQSAYGEYEALLSTEAIVASLKEAGWQSNLDAIEELGIIVKSNHATEEWNNKVLAYAIAVLQVGAELFVINGLVKKDFSTDTVVWVDPQYQRACFKFLYIHILKDENTALKAMGEICEILGLYSI